MRSACIFYEFVAGDDVFITEFTPAAFGIMLLVPGFKALMAVFRVIAGNKVQQIV